MALIEVFHVVASSLPIDAVNDTDIPQGLVVSLDANGNVTPADGDAANTEAVAQSIGIAGDSRSGGTTSYTPDSGSALTRNPATATEGTLVTGAYGAATRFTQNRVADDYNETLASGKMTVYHSGGEFWTDQYEIVDDGAALCEYTPASRLYASGATEAAAGPAAADVIERMGRFTDAASTSTTIVGYVLTAPTAYPSGVPGTDVGFTALPEGGNSLTWGNFLHLKLSL